MVTPWHALMYIIAGLTYLVPVLPFTFRLLNLPVAHRWAQGAMAVGRFTVGGVMVAWSAMLLFLAPVALALAAHALVQLMLLRQVSYHAQMLGLLPLGAITAVSAVISGVMTTADGNFAWVPHIIKAIRGKATAEELQAMQESLARKRRIRLTRYEGGWESPLTNLPDIVEGLADTVGDAGHGDAGDGGDAGGH